MARSRREDADTRRRRQLEQADYWLGEMNTSWLAGPLVVIVLLPIAALDRSLIPPFLIVILLLGVPFAIRQRLKE